MIPKKIIDEYLPMARGASFFGEPIEDMSREELMALVAYAWKQMEVERNRRCGEFSKSNILGVGHDS